MKRKIRLILRPRHWGETFLFSIILLVICSVCIYFEIVDNWYYIKPITLVKSIFGILICIYAMFSASERVIVTDKRIKVETMIFFKRIIMLDDIDRVVIGYRRARPKNGFGFIRYKGIDIYSKGKKYGDISEQWFYYDDLIKFFEEKNIPIKLEEEE